MSEHKFRASCNGSSFLRSTGRIAGDGILEDDYSETSGGKKYNKSGYPKFVTDKFDPRTMNGPVIIVQEGNKKHD